MNHALQIQTGARLHFGPLTNGRQRGRLFGGIGMMIGWPQLEVTVELSESDFITAPDALLEKIAAARDAYRNAVAQESCPSVTVKVQGDVALHSGFGTGTQLALALAHALDYLYGHQHPLEQLAAFMKRGKRSALGVHGFQTGGFLVDGGKRQEEELGTLVAQSPVCPDWRVLLITPGDSQGLSGPEEEAAFAELAEMPLDVTDHLCRLVLLEILPALAESDFGAFSTSIHEYGASVGDYFAPIQGGRYAHARMASLVDWLRNEGIQGVGQSSWGPTIFAFCESAGQAAQLKSQILLQADYADCRMEIAHPLNSGAQMMPFTQPVES